MDDDECEESPVDGHPTTSQILETTYEEDGVEKPRLRLKINLGGPSVTEGIRKKGLKPAEKQKLHRKAINNTLSKRRGRPPKRSEDNDILPMLDDDDVDGVYATASLDRAVTYTDEDFLDPEEVEDGEEITVDGGPYVCGFCKFDLEKHRARHHNRNTLYMCQLCDFESVWTTHDEPRSLICEDCGFATSNTDHMTTHRRQHTGDMFYCHIEGCDYSSPKKSQLAAHLRTHMAVRAHMCKVKSDPPEALFRPIPANESVSQWAESQSFQASLCSSNSYIHVHLAATNLVFLPNTLVFRSPHNHSDPFGMNTPTDLHRPMSLPPYGQMQGQGAPMQQQQHNQWMW
uniref:C2H2-type domain-containing protein n=1 Tax=Heterorhabditis bacteriophora TaxID=37862 RepID=A0A1I7XAV8_HETBA